MIASRLDESQLSVLLDLRSPHCHLALGPAIALGRELGIAINWLPLRVPPLSPPSQPAPGDDRGIRHRRARARAIAREIETYAAAQRLVIREPYRAPDPGAFERGWLWLRERAPAALEGWLADAFRSYWALELDPSDEAAIAKRVEAHAGDARDFLDWCASDAGACAAALDRELRERGVHGVPAYWLEDELFLGRQHLPMIRWILAGRRGPVPI